MVRTRWWSLILLLTAAMAAWGGVQRAHAVDVCEAGKLKARNVSARLDFDYHDRSYAQVISTLTVSVSAKEWDRATDLALSEKSAPYQRAMRCLLRGREAVPRSREWRFHDPQVSVRGDLVTVNYEATAWIEQNRPFLLGPWRIEVDEEGDDWRVFLRPPNTLKNAAWGQVEVRLDGLEATNVFPPPSSADPERLVWSEPEPFDVRVEVDPPWQRSFNVGEQWWSLGWVGVATWWMFTSLLSAAAVLYASRQQPGASVPAGASGTPGPAGFARLVLLWAVLSMVVAAVLRALIVDRPPSEGPTWRHLVAIALALALVLAARPWCRTGSSPRPTPEGAAAAAGTEDAPRRRARAVVLIASAVALAGLLSVVALPGLVGLTLLALGTLWLWLAAMVAWAWRFAREGAIVRRSWNDAWETAPVRSTLVVTALLALAAAALLTSFWWTHARWWSRAYWLIDGSETGRDREWTKFLVQFPYSGLTWVYAYAWMLTGLALVALLQIRVRDRQGRPEEGDKGPPLGPVKADLLLTVAVFALSVGFRQVEFAGSNLLFGAWLLLMIASLYAVVTVGRRFSVLGRTEGRFRVRRLGTERRRRVLLHKAHEFRNLHHKLYALDRGRGEGDLSREELEERLDGLHHWLFDGRGEGPPPAQISVLDVALSWGPGEDWWDNAKRAARLAFGFGFPASVALVWLSYLKDDRTQMATFQSLSGLPEIAAKCLAWQVAWAGGGLVLGALWRVLPGRRSPVRALSLTAAYAIPVCVGALVTQITDTELGYVFLHVALMLLVLTLTSIWMDMATFTEERRFWPSRVGLLLSVYQLRGLSTQVAYLAAQLAIVVGVWRSLAGSDSRPK
ncbi:DUF6185 family protein [Streptomyces sp. NPDC090077]|uniref:DUF6185 family protein n=1 Tax=Streptomyces sp. NPDC090077 TaxID=3365938 RepID=UPI003821ECED